MCMLPSVLISCTPYRGCPENEVLRQQLPERTRPGYSISNLANAFSRSRTPLSCKLAMKKALISGNTRRDGSVLTKLFAEYEVRGIVADPQANSSNNTTRRLTLFRIVIQVALGNAPHVEVHGIDEDTAIRDYITSPILRRPMYELCCI
jgi:hypothetical protein